MVVADRRLDLLTSELTGKQRAVLCLRAWCQGEKVDDRVVRYCPPADKPEMDRICEAVEEGNGRIHQGLIMLLEWTANMESDLEWLKVLTLYQEHAASLEQVAKKPVEALPPPWKSERQVPLGWGVLTNLDDPTPKDWAEFRELTRLGIQRNLRRRWQEVLSYDRTFAELAEALGEELVHFEVRERLEWLRESILRLHSKLEALGVPFELPEPEEAQLTTSRGHFDWAALRAVPKEKHAREWMHPKQQEELESWEREQAEQLRTGT
jgi:hypothetical protein